ncbi:MAG: hypothetical protein NTY61_02935 [Candidatus Parcubacteria bacterium]|nr:hypothetical protein [Candidatus Parcubacteria bacterium]
MKFWSKINSFWIRLGLVSALLLLVVVPFMVSAQTTPNPQQELDNAARVAGLVPSQTDLTVIIGSIISIVIQFLGIIAVIIVLIGGFIWMTSGGDSEKIKKARDLMTNGIIGLVIIILAYAIVTFILKRVVGLTVPTTP